MTGKDTICEDTKLHRDLGTDTDFFLYSDAVEITHLDIEKLFFSLMQSKRAKYFCLIPWKISKKYNLW